MFSSMGKAASRRQRAALARKGLSANFRWAKLSGFRVDLLQDPTPLFFRAYRFRISVSPSRHPVFWAAHFDHYGTLSGMQVTQKVQLAPEDLESIDKVCESLHYGSRSK